MNTPDAIPLTGLDLATGSLLVLLCGVISLLLRLRIERNLLWATLRMCVQLLLVGYVLQFIFQLDHPLPILLLLGLMVLIAARNAVRRPTHTYAGAHLHGMISMVCSAFLVLAVGTQAVIGVDPWYSPRYLIPLCGMLLGNSLTGISLALDNLLETLKQRRDQIEADLALGATRWEAARIPIADAVRRGMIPTINAMMVMGIVSLPGMLSGQILGNEPPETAVRYQILIMFMISATVALGCISLCLLAYRRLFNDQHQLETERIYPTR